MCHCFQLTLFESNAKLRIPGAEADCRVLSLHLAQRQLAADTKGSRAPLPFAKDVKVQMVAVQSILKQVLWAALADGPTSATCRLESALGDKEESLPNPGMLSHSFNAKRN